MFNYLREKSLLRSTAMDSLIIWKRIISFIQFQIFNYQHNKHPGNVITCRNAESHWSLLKLHSFHFHDDVMFRDFLLYLKCEFSIHPHFVCIGIFLFPLVEYYFIVCIHHAITSNLPFQVCFLFSIWINISWRQDGLKFLILLLLSPKC